MILAVCANPSVDSFWSIPGLQKKTTNRSNEETYWPGGKGIHAGLALNELDEQVTVLGFWGGQTGAWLQQSCNETGVNTIGPNIDAWSRICLTMKSGAEWNETEILGSGPTIGPKTADSFNEAYSDFLQNKPPEAVMICGSVPEGIHENIYAQMATEAKEHDIPCYVDASGPLLKNTLEAKPYSIHVNLKEGRELSDLHEPAKIAQWLGEYCSAAAVTAGTDGLYLSTGDKLLHGRHQLDSSKIISTIGSGDCLFAGFCHASLKTDPLEQRVKLAVACGSANCIHPPLGMLQKADVETIAPEVTLREINT